MIIASQKRKENIAEYLLYMWQVEDIIRANGLDIDRIKANVIDRFNSLTPEQRKEMTEWYESLIDMMRREGVAEHGHLQMNRNMMMRLVELHKSLLADPKYGEYAALFYQTLPYIVDLRARAGEAAEDEVTTCFTALYGMLLLRLQGKEISPETATAIKQIGKFIATLSSYFHKDEQTPLFEPEISPL